MTVICKLKARLTVDLSWGHWPSFFCAMNDSFKKFVSIGIAPRGVIAIGLVPMGFIAIGGVSMGIITVGAVGMGLINACFVGCGLIVYGIKVMGLS